jgi:hypothetical protein
MRKLVKKHFGSKDLLLPAKRKTIYDNAKRFYALVKSDHGETLQPHASTCDPYE